MAACGAVIDPALGQHQPQQHPHSAFPFSQQHHVHCLSCCAVSAAGSGTVGASSICQHSCCGNHRCLGTVPACSQHSQVAAVAVAGHPCFRQLVPPRQVALGNGANSSAAAVRTAHLPPRQSSLQHVYDVGELVINLFLLHPVLLNCAHALTYLIKSLTGQCRKTVQLYARWW
ncbi:unnamed protein product [Schistocephalus solidus]|uniref:Uncharacterized protein n=1 Tax=Schistocephalus solidus TaxID=70667 RepID=A0A183SAY4_SCHSO|nr:unnamed protein product [Schistocephalus solidus]